MRLNNLINRTTLLLILLLTGWAAGAPVRAQGYETVIEAVPDPEKNLEGSWNADGTAIQPLKGWYLSEYGVSFTFDQGAGSTAPAYYYNNTNIRLYAGNTFSVYMVPTKSESVWGEEMSSVSRIDFYSNYTSGDASYLQVSSGTVSYDKAGNIYTWVNTDGVEYVEFSVKNESRTYVRFTHVNLYMGGGSGEIVAKPLEPVLSQKSCNFYQPFDLTITDLNEPAATVKYTLDGSDPSADNGLIYTGPITIPTGANVTVKAVAVNDNGVSSIVSATYTYVQKYKLSFKLPNKNGIAQISYSSDSDYRTLNGEGEGYVTEGANVELSISTNSGYDIVSVTMNGTELSFNSDYWGGSYTFIMPAKDSEVVIDSKFNPSSPSDPQPGNTTKKYKLTVVSNPVGAGSVSDSGEYEAGESIRLYSYSSTGYVFTGWTKDGSPLGNSTYLDYVMPAEDVVLTANFVYNPQNPSDPNQPKLMHPLTVVASPAGAGTFSSTGSKVAFGEQYYVNAYPQSGYRFKGWIVNGEAQENTTTQLTGVMTDAGAHVVGLFVFDPSSPDEPNVNYYDPATGRMVIDRFNTGNLSNAIRTLLGSSGYDAITSLTVKGVMNSYDLNCIRSMVAIQAVDLSRTTGITSVPSGIFTNLPLTSLVLPASVTSVNASAFNGCSGLVSLSVHALTPPTVTASTFSGFTPEGCVLLVPEESIALYEDADVWKTFNAIMPLGSLHVLEVQLPSGYRDGRLKNHRIEIVNTASGARQRYVITDRYIYTFNGVQKDDEYLVRMVSETGLEMARIENVVIPDADYAVAFTTIKEMVPVSAQVVTEDGTDVTEQCLVEWYQNTKDDSKVYLVKGVNVGNVPEGESLTVKTSLDRDLSMKYRMPSETAVDVQPGMGPAVITLEPLRTTIVTGSIVDEEGNPMGNASVNVAQRIAGRYDRSTAVRPDKQGVWSAVIVDAPHTTVTYSAPECVIVTDTIAPDMETASFDLGQKTLSSSVGARIKVNLTYSEAVKEGETAENVTSYTDFDKLVFRVYNADKSRNYPVSVQYPTVIVLDPDLKADDVLLVTVAHTNGEIKPMEKAVAVGENARPDVTFDLKGKGGVNVSYSATDNPQSVAMLFNADGKFVGRQTFDNRSLSFKGLDAGTYTVLAMIRSEMLNACNTVGALTELGLKEGKDFASKQVTVADGILSDVEFETVPSVDESLYSFTGANTSLTPNKSSITSGQYLTIRSILDFKPVYRSRVSNVRMEFIIPDGCKFVDQSMMKGSNKYGYTEEGGKVVVPMDSYYSDQLRFCVVPTEGGQLEVVGSVVFDLDGQTITQPIGSAVAKVKDFDFILPMRTSYNEITATGTAPASSTVRIYQNGTLIGEGKASQGGAWQVDCTLLDTYNQKECPLQAVITTPDNLELVSGVRNVVFDGFAIMIDRVTMLTGSEEVVFDFNHKNNTQSYTWVDDRLFTFIVKLTDNAPENVANVLLYVKQLDGETKEFSCYYSQSRDAWLCVGNFTSSTAPVNVAVSIITSAGLKFDRDHFNEVIAQKNEVIEQGRELTAELENLNDEVKNVDANAAEIESVFDEVMPGLDNYTEEQIREAIARLFAVTDSELPSYDYPSDVRATDEELQKLEEEARKSLLPIEQPDFSEFDAFIQSIQDDEDYSDLEFNIADTNLTAETDLGIVNYREIAYSDVDFSQFDEEQINVLNMSDGSLVKMVYDSSQWIIADETNGKAWVIVLDETTAARFAKGDLIAELNKWIKKAKSTYDKVKAFMDVVVSKCEVAYNVAKKEVEDCRRYANDFYMGKLQCERRIRIIEQQLDAIRKNGMLDPEYAEKMKGLVKHLEETRNEDIKLFERYNKKWIQANKELAKKNVKFFAKKAILDKAVNIIDAVWRLSKIVDWGLNGLSDYNQWNAFINSILPCPDDLQNARNLVTLSEQYRNEALSGYIGAVSLAAVSGGMSTALVLMSNNPATAVMTKVLSILADYLSGWIYEKGRDIYESTRNDSRYNQNLCRAKRLELKCHNDPTDPFNKPLPDLPGDPPGNNRTEAGNDAEKRVAIDPAGFVFESVPTNRVEGVQATAYYREETEDMYGDKHLEVRLWDAAEYAQENPLFTDANGMYAWDVPPGEWQVKFEKEGYNTSFSEWLPVPPPQLEVNVEITQNAQPEVKEIHAYSEGVDITFDKYMDPETLTDRNIFVTANGERLNGAIEFLNSESSSLDPNAVSAKTFASMVRFVPEQPLSTTTGKVRLTINRNVLSYAGIPMTESFTQELDVEKEVKEITVGESLVKVLYGGDKKLTVSVIPAEAGSGRTLTVSNSSPLVTSISADELTLDENGQAELTLTGDMPGSASLKFTMTDNNKTGGAEVQVLTKLIEAQSPVASRPDGSIVYRGTKISLATESEDATIYFTTDGTCPCDENGTRRKYTVPIVIDDDTQILAMTSVGTGDEDVSGTVEFNYTLKRSDIDFMMPEGWTWMSHNFETSLSPDDLASDEGVTRILSQTREVIRDPQLGLIGTLTELPATESFKVETSSATTLQRLSDVAWNPSTPIALSSGWNWLGYPVGQTMSVDEAFASTEAEMHDIVVGQQGFAEFDGERWIGTLETMSPGMGYLYLSQSAKDVVYNTSIVSTASAKYAPGISSTSPLVLDIHKYGKIMPVVATLRNTDGSLLDNDDYQLAAFCGSECRGIGRVVNGLMMMNVYGETRDNITFRITDAEGELNFDNNASLDFNENVVGDIFDPYAITIDSQTGIGNVKYDGNIKVTVEGDRLRIKGISPEDIDFVEIYDTDGMKIMREMNVSESGIRISTLTNGIYVVIVKGNGEYSYHKIAIR